MSRIAGCFDALRASGRKALVPFVTAGDPDLEATVALLHALVEGGADVLELGVPFSDPMADGPVIQRASERALHGGATLHQVLGAVAEFRRQDERTPVVLMGYLNPVEAMGYATFARAAREAGVDGVLTVDMPPEEAADLLVELAKRSIDAIFLLAPTTTEARIEHICQVASGFVYYVSLKGVTGADKLDVAAVAERLAAIRRHTRLPVGVGFGIKDADSAARVAGIADAVVVGSALVSRIEQMAGDRAVLVWQARRFIAELRAAIDKVPSV